MQQKKHEAIMATDSLLNGSLHLPKRLGELVAQVASLMNGSLHLPKRLGELEVQVASFVRISLVFWPHRNFNNMVGLSQPLRQV